MGSKGLGKHRLTSGKSAHYIHSRRALVSAVIRRVMGVVIFMEASKGVVAESVDPVDGPSEGHRMPIYSFCQRTVFTGYHTDPPSKGRARSNDEPRPLGFQPGMEGWFGAGRSGSNVAGVSGGDRSSGDWFGGIALGGFQSGVGGKS